MNNQLILITISSSFEILLKAAISELTYNFKLMSKPNPFINKSTSRPASSNFLDKMVSQQPASLQSMRKIDFLAGNQNTMIKQNEDTENINSNTAQTVSEAADITSTHRFLKQTKALIPKPPSPLSNRKSEKIVPSSEKIILEPPILPKKCFIRQIQGSKISFQIKMAEGENEKINRSIQQFELIKKCLQPLYQSIKTNSQSIFRNLQVQSFSQIRLSSQQHIRLNQGLYFYKPIQDKSIQFLQQCFRRHPLFQQIQQVSKYLGLDFLKGYYVVKEVYKSKKIFPSSAFGFILDVKPEQLINHKQMLWLSKEFLLADKRNLLSCYLMFCNGKKRLSAMKLCYMYEELDILWACIHVLQSESNEIQNMVFELYLKYSGCRQKNQSEFLLKQFLQMRKKMATMNINQQIKSRLMEMNMNQMLTQGQFKQEDCKGHYEDLVKMLINGKQIDFKLAIERILPVHSLAEKWQNYFKDYVDSLSFTQKNQDDLLKAIYIYLLMKIFSSQGQHLPQSSERHLVKEISSFSLVLGVKFMDVICSNSVKVWAIKVIAKYNEKQLMRAGRQIGKTLSLYLPYDQEKLPSLLVNSIQQIFKDCLQKSDITVLEVQISNGKCLLSMQQDDKILESIKFYTQVFFKFPSEQQYIQASIIKFFKMLKAQNININNSFYFYDHNLLGKATTNSKIIAEHLCFVIETMTDTNKRKKVITQWLNIISKQSLYLQFGVFSQFFRIFASKITESPKNIQEMDLLMQAIGVFEHSIFFEVLKESNRKILIGKTQLQIFRMMKDIEDYCKLVKKQVSLGFVQIHQELKEKLLNEIKSPLYILNSSECQLSMSQKLSLMLLLVKQSKNQHNSSENKGKKFLQMIKRQKNFMLSNFFSYICQQLTNQAYFDVVQFLQVSIVDETLTKLVIKNRQSYIMNQILQVTKLTFLRASKLINILFSLIVCMNSEKNQQDRQKYINISCSIRAKLSLWMKSPELTESLFSNIFNLLATAMNSMRYQSHIAFLIKGIQTGYLLKLDKLQLKKLESYGLYLFGMMLSKRRRSIKVHNDQQLMQLKSQLSILVEIGSAMICNYAHSTYKELLSQITQNYVSKLVHILIQCCFQLQLKLFSQEGLKKISQALEEYKKKFGEDDFIRNQILMISKHTETLDKEKSSEMVQEEVLIQKQESLEGFNKVYADNVSIIQRQSLLSKIPSQLSRLISFLQLNSTQKIKFIGFNKTFGQRMIKNSDTILLFLKVIQQAVKMIHHEFFSLNLNKNLIEEIVQQCPVSKTSVLSFQQMIVLKIIMKTAANALESSILSPFSLLSDFDPTIVSLFRQLKDVLTRWPSPESNHLSTLTKIKLSLDYYPKGIHNFFNLWNLLLYAQKLILLLDILNYCKQMNGLGNLHHSGAVQTIVEYLSFVKKNEKALASPQEVKRMDLLHNTLQTNHLQTNTYLIFIQKNISLSWLKKMCSQIGECLNHLCFGLTEKDIQFFDSFTVPSFR